jgi:hypothetical protein
LVRHRVATLYRDLIEYAYTTEGSKPVNARNRETMEKFLGL